MIGQCIVTIVPLKLAGSNSNLQLRSLCKEDELGASKVV